MNPNNILITQNIDGLHQQSGVSNDRIIEIHGTALKANCLECEKIFSLEKFHEAFKANAPIPNCDACDGLVKVATISFGQPMNPATMEKAIASVIHSSCLLYTSPSPRDS